LLARIRVALRHSIQASAADGKKTVISTGKLEIDLVQHLVTRAGVEVKLTATEFKLLAYLAANAGRVLTHQMILSNVWDPVDANRVEYLRVYIRLLRKKLEDNPEQPRFLINEPGIGYRFMID
jgi:two-component system KDP operon response regulator KdpE